MSEHETTKIGWNTPDPGGSRRLGMALFLVSLAMLFGASVVAFAYLRLTSPALQGLDPIELPLGLFASTAVLMGAGFTMHKSWQSARRGHFSHLRGWVGRTWSLSALFVAIQVPSMWQLLEHHQMLGLSEQAGLYGITFALILVHALHVVGGMVPLSILGWKARHNRLDSEHLLTVRACAAYWHFLEAVWVALLASFFFLG
jgi:cytochrome c oxidase subunit III